MDALIKCGPMIKRSQNKKKWSIVNYKNRWFELSRSFLVYYDQCEGGREVRTLWFYDFTFISLAFWVLSRFCTYVHLCVILLDTDKFFSPHVFFIVILSFAFCSTFVWASALARSPLRKMLHMQTTKHFFFREFLVKMCETTAAARLHMRNVNVVARAVQPTLFVFLFSLSSLCEKFFHPFCTARNRPDTVNARALCRCWVRRRKKLYSCRKRFANLVVACLFFLVYWSVFFGESFPARH